MSNDRPVKMIGLDGKSKDYRVKDIAEILEVTQDSIRESLSKMGTVEFSKRYREDFIVGQKRLRLIESLKTINNLNLSRISMGNDQLSFKDYFKVELDDRLLLSSNRGQKMLQSYKEIMAKKPYKPRMEPIETSFNKVAETLSKVTETKEVEPSMEIKVPPKKVGRKKKLQNPMDVFIESLWDMIRDESSTIEKLKVEVTKCDTSIESYKSKISKLKMDKKDLEDQIKDHWSSISELTDKVNKLTEKSKNLESGDTSVILDILKFV